jgi:hypothetical protein
MITELGTADNISREQHDRIFQYYEMPCPYCKNNARFVSPPNNLHWENAYKELTRRFKEVANYNSKLTNTIRELRKQMADFSQKFDYFVSSGEL